MQLGVVSAVTDVYHLGAGGRPIIFMLNEFVSIGKTEPAAARRMFDATGCWTIGPFAGRRRCTVGPLRRGLPFVMRFSHRGRFARGWRWSE